MFALVERKTKKILQICNRDFDYFLDNEWGGMFPFVKNGQMHFSHGQVLGCDRYDCYWIEYPMREEDSQNTAQR